MSIYPVSIFLARALGIYFVAVGLGVFMNPHRFRKWYKDIFSQDRRALLIGVIALLFGSFIIAAHNIWVLDWPVIITVIGYLGIIKGAGLLISEKFLKFFEPIVKQSDRFFQLIGGLWALLGLFFLYMGFFS